MFHQRNGWQNWYGFSASCILKLYSLRWITSFYLLTSSCWRFFCLFWSSFLIVMCCINLQGMEDPTFINQYQMHSFGNPVDQSFNFQSFSSESYSSYLSFSPKPTPTPNLVENFQTHVERTAKQLKTNSWESSTSNCITPKASSSSSSQLISFGNSNSHLPADIQNFPEDLDSSVRPKEEGNMNFASVISQNHGQSLKSGPGTQRVSTPVIRNATNNQDHVIAERKRREKLTQRFIALSALVPGLKKVHNLPSFLIVSSPFSECNIILMMINVYNFTDG